LIASVTGTRRSTQLIAFVERPFILSVFLYLFCLLDFLLRCDSLVRASFLYLPYGSFQSASGVATKGSASVALASSFGWRSQVVR
jgi:hypothetical protein